MAYGTEWSDNKKTSDSYGLWHGVARQQENIWFLSHIAHCLNINTGCVMVCNDNSVTGETVSTSDSYHTLLT